MNNFLYNFLFVFCIFLCADHNSFAKEVAIANYEDRNIEIACLPHKTFIDQKYKARFLHAFELRSSDSDFGGISSLIMLPRDNKIALLTDRAFLILADIIYKQDLDAIDCIKNVNIRPLRGRSTNPLQGHYADSEGLSLGLKKSQLLVSFERHHRVVAYNFKHKRLLPQKDFKPFDKKNLPFNESYESVLSLKDKSIIAFPERYELQDEVLRGYHLMADGKVLKNIHLKRHDGYWLTDLGRLSNGDFLTLERSFSIFKGMAMQMRHIKKDDFLSGAVADGEVIFQMKTGDGVDNFEGLDIVHKKNGQNLLYLSSDNNFLSLQKTLLMTLEYNIQD